MEQEKIKDEVHRKIGRNILLFQELEYLLKYIIANCKVTGSISDLMEIKQRQNESVKTQTLGQLVGKYLEGTHGSKEILTIEGDLEEPYISFFVNVECGVDEYENKKLALASMVTERNELVHHFLPRLFPASTERLNEVNKYLDQQQAKILSEKNSLSQLLGSVQKMAEYRFFRNLVVPPWIKKSAVLMDLEQEVGNISVAVSHPL